MNLEHFLTKEQVIKIKATEKQLVIKECIDRLQELGRIENKDRYYAQVIHRESLENTGIGNGFAIPHARTDSVSDFISILGILESPIEYQSIDNKPVKCVLLSIFPTEMSTKYLYLIGMMARIFSNPEKNSSITEEKSLSKVYTYLKKEADAYFESISEKPTTETDTSVNLSGVPSANLDLLIRLDRLYQIADEGNKTASLNQKIEELKKLIDNRSLSYYERMRKKRNNPFSILEKNSCSGCHMEIPPIYIKQVKDREGITLCTHCGRFLIMI